ncbi:MAG: glycosyltransferase family 4 protein [Vicinamibacterales bacterium]
MIIAVDARELAGKPTGVGRYLASLLREWSTLPEAARHRFIVFAPEPIAVPEGLDARTRVVPGHGGFAWEQIRFPSALRKERPRPDVLFAPGYSAPVLAARIPTVVTIHDVSFFAHPEWFRPREGIRRRWTTWAAARTARIVLTVSQFSGAEIERLLGVPSSRVRVTMNAVNRLDAAGNAGNGDMPERGPLVLYVGSIFNRRRVPDLIAAFGDVAAAIPDARLEIVGEDRTYPAEDLAGAVERSHARDRIRLRSYVTDDELAELYARASVFVFLSEYEGFGLTPLEALARGVPPVVLDTPVAREVYKDAALYVAPGDVAGTAAAITTLIADSLERRHILGRAAGILEEYSWPRLARETLEAIEAAAGGA